MCNRPRQSKPDNSQYLSVKKSPFLSLHSLRFCLQERQMQFPPIKIIFNLHPPIHKVCAIKLFYSKRLSYFLYHCSHSNLTLGSDTSCRELNRISNLWETKNRENTRQRKKTITRTRQYLRGSAIFLRPRSCRDFTIIREEYIVQDAATIFPLSLKHGNTTHNETLITQSRFLYKNGPKKNSR